MRFKFDGLIGGWLLEGREHFDPVSIPSLIAHDVMEHPRVNKLDPCADELMALGAVIWGRGCGDYWDQPVEQLLCFDISSQFSVYNGLNQLKDPGKTKRLNKEIEDIINVAIDLAFQELEDDKFFYGYSDEEINSFLSFARGWLRRGYRFAKKRWSRAGQTRDSFLRMFKEIEKSIPKYGIDVGGLMYIDMCMTRGTVNVTIW